jgi:hypothetical protein
MVGDFWIVIKSSKLFRFRHDFEVFSIKNVELVHAVPALKNIFESYIKIKKVLWLFLNQLQDPKTIF